MLANILDITDGQIARAMPGRHPALGIVGAKLDTHSDVVSHCVVPACLLMRLSDVNWLITAIGLCWVIAGVFRQAYFEVSGRLESGTCIFGMTTDYMPTLVAISMHLMTIIGRSNVIIILTAITILMTFGCLSHSLRSRRYSGYGLLWVEVFNGSLTVSCLALTWMGESVLAGKNPWLSFPALSFVVHTLLAYPCYFRFVELNV